VKHRQTDRQTDREAGIQTDRPAEPQQAGRGGSLQARRPPHWESASDWTTGEPVHVLYSVTADCPVTDTHRHRYRHMDTYRDRLAHTRTQLTLPGNTTDTVSVFELFLVW